jgi:hypothetical protein
MNTPEPDLFPHATAQAPELEAARRALSEAQMDYDKALSEDGTQDWEMDALYEAIQFHKVRVTQLEAEAMRKEGR